MAAADYDGMSLPEIFRAESREHVKLINKLLLALEKTPEDMDIIDEIMRTAHTLKGAARIINNTDIQMIAHGMESLFVILKTGTPPVTPECIDLMFESLDAITAIGDSVFAGKSHHADVADIGRRLEAAQSGDMVSRIEPTPDLSESGIEEKPAEPPSVDDDKRREKSKSDPSRRKAIVEDGLLSRNSGDQTVRVGVARLDRLLNLCGELYVAGVSLDYQCEQGRFLSQACIELNENIGVLRGMIGELMGDDDDKVGPMIGKSRKVVDQIQSKVMDFYDALGRLGIRFLSLTRDLQDELMLSRMLAASVLFDPQLRCVRDLCRESGKKIEVEISGGDTLIDRRVIEAIKDPIMHLVRNACDHGIESPQARSRDGKPQEGRLSFKAYHKGDRVFVEIEDDGKGIDAELVRKKIVSGGILSAMEAQRLSHEELLNFIFMPGFSTAEKVTFISGRGEGLDVVKMNLDKINGSIALESEIGKFTRFVLSLPLTLAVSRCMLFKVGDDNMAVLLTQIDRVMFITKEQIKTVEGKEAVEYDGYCISLVHLGSLLEGVEASFADGKMPMIVVGGGDARVALVVDKFLGEKEVVVKTLDHRLGKVYCVAAATILDNGEIALILDTGDIVKAVKDYTGKTVFTRQRQEKALRRKRVLVVDDSFTVRELQKKIIANAGYLVDSAADGADGLLMARQTDYDLIVTDIDMPNMNGLDFIRTLKQEERFKELPVIIVSYKEREEDKRIGMQIGASRYIIKSEYDDKKVLEAVYQLIG